MLLHCLFNPWEGWRIAEARRVFDATPTEGPQPAEPAAERLKESTSSDPEKEVKKVEAQLQRLLDRITEIETQLSRLQTKDVMPSSSDKLPSPEGQKKARTEMGELRKKAQDLQKEYKKAIAALDVNTQKEVADLQAEIEDALNIILEGSAVLEKTESPAASTLLASNDIVLPNLPNAPDATASCPDKKSDERGEAPKVEEANPLEKQPQEEHKTEDQPPLEYPNYRGRKPQHIVDRIRADNLNPDDYLMERNTDGTWTATHIPKHTEKKEAEAPAAENLLSSIILESSPLNFLKPIPLDAQQMLVEKRIFIKDQTLIINISPEGEKKSFTVDCSEYKNIAFSARQDIDSLMITGERTDGTSETFSVDNLINEKLGFPVLPEIELQKGVAWEKLKKEVSQLNPSYPNVSAACVAPSNGSLREVQFKNTQNPDIRYTLAVSFSAPPPNAADYHDKIVQCFTAIQVGKIPNLDAIYNSSIAAVKTSPAKKTEKRDFLEEPVTKEEFNPSLEDPFNVPAKAPEKTTIFVSNNPTRAEIKTEAPKDAREKTMKSIEAQETTEGKSPRGTVEFIHSGDKGNFYVKLEKGYVVMTNLENGDIKTYQFNYPFHDRGPAAGPPSFYVSKKPLPPAPFSGHFDDSSTALFWVHGPEKNYSNGLDPTPAPCDNMIGMTPEGLYKLATALLEQGEMPSLAIRPKITKRHKKNALNGPDTLSLKKDNNSLPGGYKKLGQIPSIGSKPVGHVYMRGSGTEKRHFRAFVGPEKVEITKVKERKNGVRIVSFKLNDGTKGKITITPGPKEKPPVLTLKYRGENEEEDEDLELADAEKEDNVNKGE